MLNSPGKYEQAPINTLNRDGFFLDDSEADQFLIRGQDIK